jgi:hypothetical protein
MVPRLRKRRILLGVRRFPFLHATLQYAELVTPYSRFVFGRDKGFHATPSGRGSLVYVGLVSRRGFRCPSYWRSSPGEKRHLPATQCELRSLLRLEC